MFNPKPEIYAKLSSLGYACVQGAQETFTETPAITFRLGDNSPRYTLDNQIAAQDVEVIVDVFADDSVTLSRIVGEVESAMREIFYRLSYQTDVPSPKGALYHANCRFAAIK
jgi:hypothetical protein